MREPRTWDIEVLAEAEAVLRAAQRGRQLGLAARVGLAVVASIALVGLVGAIAPAAAVPGLAVVAAGWAVVVVRLAEPPAVAVVPAAERLDPQG